MFDIESVQAMLSGNAIKVTQHFKARIKERDINVSDVKHVLLSGEIIEQCPDDQPLPSILILGHTKDNQPLHVVVGIDDDFIFLITAYFPSVEIWETDYSTRKVVN